ncbi:DMXL1 [Cordylochernes scorpioides]|uniref:DMXL1 n=1 Tax=Cordylochernes scorpioides TaxID=51811 RepID=A0ABY6KY73_9ARAC|nr:DMXL1 [Cordylochernes scorpioides]
MYIYISSLKKGDVLRTCKKTPTYVFPRDAAERDLASTDRLEMNRHQVLTGAANSGDHCFAVGTVEGVPFTAYASGCNIVILASDFQRVQIIPGVVFGNVQVICLDCSTDIGKVSWHGRILCRHLQ